MSKNISVSKYQCDAYNCTYVQVLVIFLTRLVCCGSYGEESLTRVGIIRNPLLLLSSFSFSIFRKILKPYWYFKKVTLIKDPVLEPWFSFIFSIYANPLGGQSAEALEIKSIKQITRGIWEKDFKAPLDPVGKASWWNMKVSERDEGLTKEIHSRVVNCFQLFKNERFGKW